jgi:hypothetical protein
MDDFDALPILPPRAPKYEDFLYIYQFGGPTEVVKHILLGNDSEGLKYIFSDDWKSKAPEGWSIPLDIMDLAFNDLGVSKDIVQVLIDKGFKLKPVYIDKLRESEKLIQMPGYHSSLMMYIEAELKNHISASH